MSDGIENQELFDALRAMEPRPGARARVRKAIEARRGRRLGNVVVLSVAFAAAVAVILWLVLPQRTEPIARVEHPGARVVATHGDRWHVGDVLRGRIALSQGEELELALAEAELVVRGPASIDLEADRFVLNRGSVRVDGRTSVRGGACGASIDGICEVTSFEHSLRFVVEAGAVQATTPPMTCSIVDLEAEPDHSTADVPAPAIQPAEQPRPIVRRAPAPDPTELAEQTRAYQAALSLHDDAAALAAFRDMQRRWPRGSLAPEVDFQVVRTLVRMGRDGEARAGAQRFVSRYPRSARVAEMRRLIDAGADEPR